MIAPSGLLTKYATRLEFKATNNIVEYKGLILVLNKAKAIGKNRLPSHSWTSWKEYMAREPELAKYLAVVRALERRF